jgi:hypothetical protein
LFDASGCWQPITGLDAAMGRTNSHFRSFRIMSRFIQSLESRTLLSAASVTEAALLTDVKNVQAAAVTARGDLKSAASSIGADTKLIATDLKSSTTSANRATNAGLLRTLRVDESKTFATLRAHEAALFSVGTGLSRRAAADGKALLLHPTNARIQARVTADTTALTTEPAALLAKVQADTQNVGIGTDLTNLANANPTNTALATEIQTAQNDGKVAVQTAVTAAGAFDMNVVILDGAVASTSTGSTIPNLVGTFSGTATQTAGSHVGRVSTLMFNITSEGADGSLIGTVTITDPTNPASTQPMTGAVTANGTFAGTVSDTSGNGATLAGTVSGKTITGTFSSGTDGGTFTVSMP